jgi:hypothetical protein
VRIHLSMLRVVVFVILAGSCSFAEAQKIVKRVVIHSSEGGLGAGYSTLVIVQRKGDKFIQRKGNIFIRQKEGKFIQKKESKFLSNGRPVSAVLVQSLVNALSAPPLTGMDMTNLGITQEWLAANVESQWSLIRSRATETTASQETLFQKSFTDFNLVKDLLTYILLSEIFDYSAYCKVEIFFNHGSKLSAETYSYSVFMLPWKIEGRSFTFNADIARAVAALLPDESANKITLMGSELASQLAYAVMASLEQERDSQGARGKR